MSFLTLRKICFRIGRRFCMLEYVKNVQRPLRRNNDISGRTCLFYKPTQGKDMASRNMVDNQCWNWQAVFIIKKRLKIPNG